MNEDFWETVEVPQTFSKKARRIGVLNVALLFGTATIALTLILTPMLAAKYSNNQIAEYPFNVDRISTGSVPNKKPTDTYTIRKSILPQNQAMPCIVEGYSSPDAC